jgi:hypothetical protein
MKVELIINKDRIPYIVEQLGEDRVTVTPYNEGCDSITFEFISNVDFVRIFHAGIKHGMDEMKKILE